MSEMYRNISCEMSVISYLSYTDGECACAVERIITTVKYCGISHDNVYGKYYR